MAEKFTNQSRFEHEYMYAVMHIHAPLHVRSLSTSPNHSAKFCSSWNTISFEMETPEEPGESLPKGAHVLSLSVAWFFIRAHTSPFKPLQPKLGSCTLLRAGWKVYRDWQAYSAKNA